jgi:hypothetical protein
MLTRNLALISEVEGHDPSDVARVAAALQRQASRDFGPIWEVSATVDAFPRAKDMPVGYWPMFVRNDIEQEGAEGIHLDKHGQPYALITYSDSWSLTASHEMCEMLADPSGNRLVPGKSPKPDQGRVAFLLEVCDPSEAAEFGYTVNDVLVSDFYTPHFFDPVAVEGVRYSFTGAIKKPRDILAGGYISWIDPVSNQVWQEKWFQNGREIVEGPSLDGEVRSLRAEIDKWTPHPQLSKGLDPTDPTLEAAIAVGEQTAAAADAKAAQLQEEIAAVLASA